jgi:tetratricopeptide (TPR) repeat protein
MKAAAFALAAVALAVPGAVGADATALGVGYICGAERTAPRAGPLPAVMLTGVGNGSSPADTSSREAQGWYDEGLNLYHAFNHNEASAAFAKAAALDPACALCEWGVALGLGQTLNYGVTPAQTAVALSHADRAAKLVKPGDVRAQGVIAALQLRYGKDTPDAKRDTVYGQAMDDLVRRFPGDDEIANVAVQALLIPARRDDFSGVPRAEAILKDVLARHPDDTAAIHYYIHATEFAGHPAQALPYADKLAGLAPGASHLVHMAAHTLMHVGQYERVAVVDAQALKVDADVEAKLRYAGPLSSQVYYLHNYTFGLAGALMAGDGRLALKYADHAAVAFPATFDHGVVAMPPGVARSADPVERRTTASARSLVAYGRYAPDRALALADAAGDPRILRVYRHYARGEAFATRGDAAGVRHEAEAVEAIAAEAGKASEPGTVDIAAIAGDVLAGRAALLTREPAKAVEAFARAAQRQEKAFPVAKNFDPPPWWYPVRRSLAAADLAAGKPADAAREAKASLAGWPDDALALRVLSQAEAKLGDASAANAHLVRARRAWRGDLSKAPLDLT